MDGGMLCHPFRVAFQVLLGTRLLMRLAENRSFSWSKRNGYRQDNSNYSLLFIYASIKSLITATKLQLDLGMPMASMMKIGSEVFGGHAREVDVLVELKNGNDLLCFRRKYLTLVL